MYNKKYAFYHYYNDIELIIMVKNMNYTVHEDFGCLSFASHIKQI